MGNKKSKSRGGKTSRFDSAMEEFNSMGGEVESVNTSTVLLLGCGDSGKTTLMNRFRLNAELEGLRKADNIEKSSHVLYALVEMFKLLLSNIQEEMQSISLEDEAVEVLIRKTVPTQLEKVEKLPIKKELADNLEKIWNNPKVQSIFKQKHRSGQKLNSMEYFSKNLKRYSDPKIDFMELDVLYTSSRTSGVISESFKVKNHSVNVVDFGGQRSERRKWGAHFGDVDIIVFLVSAIEFDEILFEDSKQNRLQESLKIFIEMVNHEKLKGADFLLVFSKTDILEEKIKQFKEEGEDLLSKFPAEFDMESLRGKDINASIILNQMCKIFTESVPENAPVSTFLVNCMKKADSDKISAEILKILKLPHPVLNPI